MELLQVDIQLGCSETTRVDLRNRRGVCFLKSWAAQRPRKPISEIEEALASSKVGLLRDHEGRSQKSKRHLLFQPCQHMSHAHLALRKSKRFAFSKAGLLRDHEGRSQKSKRFAFSKAGLLRDHEGRSQKSKRFAFSKAGLLRDHEGRSQKSKRFAFSKAGLLRDHEGRSQKSKRHLLFQPCQHLSHAHSALRKLWAFCRRFLAK
ncbi:hypothetical protein ACFX1X_045482 [Malus domestica]